MVELGKSSVYSEPAAVVDPEVAGFVAGDSPLTEEQVRDGRRAALAEEIRLMLDEGVVQAVQDIDLCMLLGAGWPFQLGGISPTWTAPASPSRHRRPVPPARRRLDASVSVPLT